MEDKKEITVTPPEAVRYGGQAVMEGVMMRGKTCYSISVRHPEKGVSTVRHSTASKLDKHKFVKWPIIRGVVSFGQSLVMGMKVISESADMAGFDDLTEENPSKFDHWLEAKFGDKLKDYIMMLSVVLSIVLSIALFMLLPVWLSSLIKPLLGEGFMLLSALEGFMRILIFLLYLFLISRMKEVQRLFGYHGAEHKSLACLESGDELTVENARKQSRLHKRCGTSFLFLVMLVSMIVFFFVRTDVFWLRIVSRICLVPVVAGLSYEVLRWAGRHDNWFVKAVSFPGLCMQRLTTAEPDDGQIEVAIAALKEVIKYDNGYTDPEPEHPTEPTPAVEDASRPAE